MIQMWHKSVSIRIKDLFLVLNLKSAANYLSVIKDTLVKIRFKFTAYTSISPVLRHLKKLWQ